MVPYELNHSLFLFQASVLVSIGETSFIESNHPLVLGCQLYSKLSMAKLSLPIETAHRFATDTVPAAGGTDIYFRGYSVLNSRGKQARKTPVIRWSMRKHLEYTKGECRTAVMETHCRNPRHRARPRRRVGRRIAVRVSYDFRHNNL